MYEDISKSWEPATVAIRVGHKRTAEGEHSEPIFTTSSYVFANAAEAAARFAGESPGNIYSRFTNPTVKVFEERLAALEGGSACVATASGMSAIMAMCLGLLRTGDHIVASQAIFGPTSTLLHKYLGRLGITTTQVPLGDVTAWEAAILPNTKLMFAETPSNPLTEMADIRTMADLAHSHGCLLAIDNCFCTPALQRPLALGAHWPIDVLVGAAVGLVAAKFGLWSAKRFSRSGRFDELPLIFSVLPIFPLFLIVGYNPGLRLPVIISPLFGTLVLIKFISNYLPPKFWKVS